AIDFCVAGLAGSVADLISVTRRSARKFVKKLIQPFRWGPARGHVFRTYPAAPSRSRQSKVSGAAQILAGGHCRRRFRAARADFPSGGKRIMPQPVVGTDLRSARSLHG